MVFWWHHFFWQIPDDINISFTSSHAASFVCTEGTDRLSTEIKVLQESKYLHRHGSPVVGISKIDHIILVNAFRIMCQFRSCISQLILLSLLSSPEFWLPVLYFPQKYFSVCRQNNSDLPFKSKQSVLPFHNLFHLNFRKFKFSLFFDLIVIRRGFSWKNRFWNIVLTYG